jgi:hypothetical protein
MNCGIEPSEPIVVKLNEHLTFRFRNRTDAFLDFQYGNIRYSFNLASRERRTAPDYLKTASRAPGGKLIPKIEYTTLKERQIQFNETLKAQRNKLHPKSANLSEMVRDIVHGLEERFDGIASMMATTPGVGSEWKSSALSTTLGEIPRIPIAGTETGTTSGFGEHLYTPAASFDMSKTVSCDTIFMNNYCLLSVRYSHFIVSFFNHY